MKGQCDKCGGYGYVDIATVDWVPYGSGNVPMYGGEREICPKCLEKDICPKCGRPMDYTGTLTTSTWHCDWCGYSVDFDNAPENYLEAR